jgi:ElaB/YqjD/DUF883 family membrane-anchored ribosome-binding protein
VGVLDEMTKGITEVSARKKAAAGASLTPVGLEGLPTKPSMVGVPDVAEVFLTNEALHDHAQNLRKFAADAIAIADGLDAMTTKDSTPTVSPKAAAVAEKKAAEKKADEKFSDRMDRLKKKTQATVFEADDPVGEPSPGNPNTPEVSADDGWQCPEHEDEDIKNMTSRLRPAGYLACAVPGCGEFEPKA